MLSGLENPLHLLVILLVVVLIFGGKRLPEVGRSLGSGIRSFKSSLDGHHHDEPAAALAPPREAAGGTSPASVAPAAPVEHEGAAA
ncbi:MAG: hypothetical protein NVSMB25_07280 [Thermoleophilaceae bacterium]